jgi:hypothetical protein
VKSSLTRIVSLCTLLTVAVPGALRAQEIPAIMLASLPDAPGEVASPQPQSPAPAVQTENSSSQTATSPAKNEKEKKKEEQEAAERQLKKQEQQHLLGVVPSYNVVYDSSAPPLNPRQKFELAFKISVNPYQFALVGAVAAIGQAQDSFPEYGQGWKGYGKRYGAGYFDAFDGNMIGNAALPVLLHQDPRYYRMGTGSIKKRFLYAVAFVAICKGDNGKWQPGYSNILGNLAAGGISNLYYPASDRGFGLTVERGMTVTAEGAIANIIQEFVPDIQKRYFHKKTPVAASSDGTTQP